MICPEYDELADHYDTVLPHLERRDVAFYVDATRRAPGSVIELGCGTGRLLVPIARAGVDVVGLDTAMPLLRRCQARLASEPPEVRRRAAVLAADMREFHLRRRFSLAIVPFRGFQHLLSDAEQRAALATARAHLCDNARLILDLYVPGIDLPSGSHLPTLPAVDPETPLPGGGLLQRHSRVVSHDADARRLEIEVGHRMRQPNGLTRSHVGRYSLRYVLRHEAERLLEASGFDVEAVFGGFDRDPVAPDGRGDLVFVARRAGGVTEPSWPSRRSAGRC
jgi:SAM-dependent methyltransferase